MFPARLQQPVSHLDRAAMKPGTAALCERLFEARRIPDLLVRFPCGFNPTNGWRSRQTSRAFCAWLLVEIVFAFHVLFLCALNNTNSWHIKHFFVHTYTQWIVVVTLCFHAVLFPVC